jgi:predicted nucleotidyltransferase
MAGWRCEQAASKIAQMHEVAENAMQEAAVDFARRLLPIWQSALGPELLGVYLVGSLAHGGFSARYSDIDVAVTTEAGVPQPVLDRMRSEAVALSSDWGPKLSVFWADRRFAIGRFPALDRIDYLDHARALMEREPVRPPRPSLDEIRGQLADALAARWTETAHRFAAAAALEPKDRKAYLRTLLYPARFCYSWLTGRMGSNDEAVAFLARTPPPGLDIALIARALACRRADADPDALFAARTQLPSQIEACAALLDRRAAAS